MLHNKSQQGRKAKVGQVTRIHMLDSFLKELKRLSDDVDTAYALGRGNALRSLNCSCATK